MAVTRSNICKNGIQSLSRGGAAIYYASVFLYFWVFSTPVVSLVFGIYLYICINWFHLHFDEAFSSLRIANYKAFTRFHINKDGDLEVFTLAVDKVKFPLLPSPPLPSHGRDVISLIKWPPRVPLITDGWSSYALDLRFRWTGVSLRTDTAGSLFRQL